MARAELSVTINRAIVDVFAVLSTSEKTPRWSPSALEGADEDATPSGTKTRSCRAPIPPVRG